MEDPLASITSREIIEAFKIYLLDECVQAIEDLLLEIDASTHYGFVIKYDCHNNII